MYKKIRPLLVRLYRFLNHIYFFWGKRITVWRYLRKNKTKKLQLGCGTNLLPGWLNTDLYAGFHGKVALDVTKKFPFKDNTFSYIFTEHLIEHIPYAQAEHMIAECYRVLKPGGVIRIATPNLQFLFDLYSKKLTATQKKYMKWSAEKFWGSDEFAQPTFMLNNFVRNWGHQFIYDFKSLARLLESQGFGKPLQCAVKESKKKELRNLEMHGTVIGEEFNALETLVIEGKKG